MDSNEILSKTVVLVLNKFWVPINSRTPSEIYPMLATDVATALDIQGADYLRPVSWAEWLTLPVRVGDNFIHTPRQIIRVPTVVIAVNYSGIPKRRPAFSAKAIRDRDNSTCQYTGRKLKPEESNIDHIQPRSRGGKTSWENCVLAAKDVNSKKANLTPGEAGLRLLRTPKAPPALPSVVTIRNSHGIADWDLFLKHK